MSNTQSVNQMIEAMKNNPEFNEMMTIIAGQAILASGDPSFARFMQAITAYSRDQIKPQFSVVKASMKPEKASKSNNPKAPVDNTWRVEQKALFNGRGMQWIYVDIDQVKEHLGEDEQSQAYLEAINNHGKAWVRYSGPRNVDDNQFAAFELRTDSKVPSKTKILIAHDLIMEEQFERLEDGKTPAMLGLESGSNNQDEDDEPINILDVQAPPQESNPEPEVSNDEMNMLLDDDDMDNLDEEIFG